MSEQPQAAPLTAPPVHAGRPRIDAQTNNYDGSLTLANPREEKIAELIVSGMAAVHAYKATAKKPLKYCGAKASASRLVNRPDFARRLSWLTARRNMAAKSAPTGHGMTPTKPVAPEPVTRTKKTGVMSRDDLMRELSDLVRSAETEQTRVSAANALAKLAYDSAESVIPSPETIIEWLSNHAGQGRRFGPGVRALMAWCKAGLDDLRGVLAEIERETTGGSVSGIMDTTSDTISGADSPKTQETPANIDDSIPTSHNKGNVPFVNTCETHGQTGEGAD